MGSRRGEGGEDQAEIIGLAPGGKGDGNGEAVTFGDQQAVNGRGERLKEAVTGNNVREALLPIFAKRAAMHIGQGVAETSASRPGEVKRSYAKS